MRTFGLYIILALTLQVMSSAAFAVKVEVVPFDPRACESLLLPQEMAVAKLSEDGFEIFKDVPSLSEETIEALFTHLSAIISNVSLNSRMSPFLLKELKAEGALEKPVNELNAYVSKIQKEIEARLPEDAPLVLDDAELRVSTGPQQNDQPFKIGYHFDGGWLASTVALKGTATFLRNGKGHALPPRRTPLVFSALDKQALTGTAPTLHGQPYGLKEERFLMVLRFLPKYKFRSIEQLSRVKKGLGLSDSFREVIPFFTRREVLTSRHVEQFEMLYDANRNGECYQFTFIESRLTNWSKVRPERCTPP